MHKNKKKYLACSLESLKNAKSIGVELDLENVSAQYFLIYYENRVFSYLNRCPHTGINLDWNPNQFLDTSNQFIQCSTHGALFNIENGLCLRGPCLGDKLQIVENIVSEDNIYLIL